MIKIIIDLSLYLFSFISLILLTWAGFSYSKGARDRFSILKYPDGKKHYFVLIIIVFGFFTFIGQIYLHFSKPKETVIDIPIQQEKHLPPLKPRHPDSFDQNQPTNQPRLGMAGRYIDIVAPVGCIVEPWGDSVPLWFRISDSGLFVSAVIKDFYQSIVAELHDNSLYNPNNYYDLLIDSSALEIIDNLGLPVLQVEYVNSHRFLIGGIFQRGAVLNAIAYPNFPASNIGFGGYRFEQILVNGKFGFVTLPFDVDKNYLIKIVKETVPPIFDSFKSTKSNPIRLPEDFAK